MGNSSLLPNIGLTNSYDTSCIAIHESIQQIRLGICMVSGLTFLVVFFFWGLRLFELQWGKLVVFFYLAFFAVLLGVAEFIALMGLKTMASTNGASALAEPKESPWSGPLRQVQNNFGFLFHPVGKPAFLILMATLCWALGGIWEFFLGFAYFLMAIVLTLFGQETEFRRNYYPELPDPTDNKAMDYMPGVRAATWSYFSSKVTGTPAETATLLRTHYESM